MDITNKTISFISQKEIKQQKLQYKTQKKILIHSPYHNQSKYYSYSYKPFEEYNKKHTQQIVSSFINHLVEAALQIISSKNIHEKVLSENMKFFQDTYHLMKQLPDRIYDHPWNVDIQGNQMISSLQSRKSKFKQNKCLRASKIVNTLRNSISRRILKHTQNNYKTQRQNQSPFLMRSTQYRQKLKLTSSLRNNSEQYKNQSYINTPLSQRNQQAALKLLFKNLINTPSKRCLVPLKQNFIEESPFEQMKRQQYREYLKVKKIKMKQIQQQQKQMMNTFQQSFFKLKKDINNNLYNTFDNFKKEFIKQKNQLIKAKTQQSQKIAKNTTSYNLKRIKKYNQFKIKKDNYAINKQNKISKLNKPHQKTQKNKKTNIEQQNQNQETSQSQLLIQSSNVSRKSSIVQYKTNDFQQFMKMKIKKLQKSTFKHQKSNTQPNQITNIQSQKPKTNFKKQKKRQYQMQNSFGIDKPKPQLVSFRKHVKSPNLKDNYLAKGRYTQNKQQTLQHFYVQFKQQQHSAQKTQIKTKVQVFNNKQYKILTEI